MTRVHTGMLPNPDKSEALLVADAAGRKSQQARKVELGSGAFLPTPRSATQMLNSHVVTLDQS